MRSSTASRRTPVVGVSVAPLGRLGEQLLAGVASLGGGDGKSSSASSSSSSSVGFMVTQAPWPGPAGTGRRSRG